ncbi:hypothetical protein [Vibrio cyclitrophicus]|uniref:hypothetical protein n=1 Tax=Vibrio cyclitrophicus TaxID=47951 RepID=UPI0035A60684
MKKLSVNQIKAIKTEQLLLDVINKPNNFTNDGKLIHALRSQGALAKYDNPALNITSCSLNTLKSNCNDTLKRKYKGLEILRVNAKTAIEDKEQEPKVDKPNKETLSGLRLKVNELNSELESLRFACFNLTNIIGELRSFTKKLAVYDGTSDARYTLYKDQDYEIRLKLDYTNQFQAYKNSQAEYQRFLNASN